MANPAFNGNQFGANPMMQNFQRFMQQMRGQNPQDVLNNLVQSGRINQAQLNQAQQMAQQMSGALNPIRSMFGF